MPTPDPTQITVNHPDQWWMGDFAILDNGVFRHATWDDDPSDAWMAMLNSAPGEKQVFISSRHVFDTLSLQPLPGTWSANQWRFPKKPVQ